MAGQWPVAGRGGKLISRNFGNILMSPGFYGFLSLGEKRYSSHHLDLYVFRGSQALGCNVRGGPLMVTPGEGEWLFG